MSVSEGKEKREKRGRPGAGELAGLAQDDDGPVMGWPGLELGCGQFLFFDKSFSFSFSLVLKLTIKS